MTLRKRIKHWKEYLMDTTWLADMGHTDEEVQHYSDAETLIDDLLAETERIAKERDKCHAALSRIATATMSQHLNKESMIVDLQVMAREAL